MTLAVEPSRICDYGSSKIYNICYLPCQINRMHVFFHEYYTFVRDEKLSFPWLGYNAYLTIPLMNFKLPSVCSSAACLDNAIVSIPTMPDARLSIRVKIVPTYGQRKDQEWVARVRGIPRTKSFRSIPIIHQFRVTKPTKRYWRCGKADV